MAKTASKLWYAFVSGEVFTEKDPCFFDLQKKDWLIDIEANWQLIRAELLQVLAEKNEGLMPYFNRNLANKPQKWTIFPFLLWGVKLHKNCQKCPLTIQILTKIPHLSAASFSILAANTSIKAHLGDTNAIYRCHLGLSIPAGLPECGMQVGEEQKPWKEGQVFAFCDAQKHTAWNNSSDKRFVLIFDVIRPEFAPQKKRICANILAALFWQTLFQRFYIIGYLPTFMRKVLMHVSSYPAQLYVFLHNYWGGRGEKK